MWWRLFIPIFCAAFISLNVLELSALQRLIASSRMITAPVAPFVDRVLEVRPGGLAQQLGLRPGDVIDLRNASPADRWAWGLAYPIVGKPTHLTVQRGNQRRTIGMTPQKDTHWFATTPLNVYVGAAGFIWFLLFAGFVGVRCADDPRARLLSIVIALIPAASILAPNNWISPWPAVNVVAAALNCLFRSAAEAALIAYTLRFAAPASASRRRVAAAAFAVIAIDVAINLTYILGYWFGVVDFNLPTWTAVFVICDAGAILALIAAFSTAMHDAHGDDRSRLAWSTIPLLFMYAVGMTTEIAANAFPQVWTSAIAIAINNIALFVAPLGLTYALLAQRILDIGFALNRAAIFAATSAILAGVFAGLQWGASTLLAGVLPTRSYASQIAIIVAVYYIVRLSRRSTDAFITRVFFAARDRRLRALGDAIAAVDEVQDAAALAPFIVDYLGSHAGIMTQVYYQDADGAYAPVAGCNSATAPLGRDSTGVVALRSRREPLALPDLHQPGSVACPMLVRGRLRGIMICHAPNDGELAPDEVRALAAIANRVAGDRDDLLAEELRRENQALHLEVRQLRFGTMSPQP